MTSYDASTGANCGQEHFEPLNATRTKVGSGFPRLGGTGDVYMGSSKDGAPPPEGRWMSGPSIDGKGEFSVMQNNPMGEIPVLGPARDGSGAQAEQIGKSASGMHAV